jgi:hypothetical protein
MVGPNHVEVIGIVYSDSWLEGLVIAIVELQGGTPDPTVICTVINGRNHRDFPLVKPNHVEIVVPVNGDTTGIGSRQTGRAR